MRIKNYNFKDFLDYPTPISQKQHHKNCIAESKENYKLDLGRLNIKHLKEIQETPFAESTERISSVWG